MTAELSEQTKVALFQYGIMHDDLDTLCRMSKAMLRCIPHIGTKRVVEITAYLAHHGRKAGDAGDMLPKDRFEPGAPPPLEVIIAQMGGSKIDKIARLLGGNRTGRMSAKEIAKLVGCTETYVRKVKRERTHHYTEEKRHRIPGMKGTLTTRAANALYHMGIDPSDKSEVEKLGLSHYREKLLYMNGVGRWTYTCIIDFISENGVSITFGDDAVPLGQALELAKKKKQHEEAQLSMQPEPYAVGSAWEE
jgi:hypothetical protein